MSGESSTKAVQQVAGLTAAGASEINVLGSISAPWAVDANGRQVPTSYTVQGNTVTQRVSVTSSTAFPVVADPRFLWANWYTPEILYTKAETKVLRNTMAAAAGIAAACAAIGSETIVFGVGCGTAAAEAGVTAAVASNAYGDGKCLAQRYLFIPWEVNCTTGK